MVDTVFTALDFEGNPVQFEASQDGVKLTPYRRAPADQQLAITDGLQAIVDAIAAGGGGAPATVQAKDTELVAGAAEDVFTGGAAYRCRFKNIGPNDGYYRIGADATGDWAEDSGNHQLVVGQEITLPYVLNVKISMFSTDGTFIEAEQW